MRRFCVLVCGTPSPRVVQRAGGYYEQLTRLLSSNDETWCSFETEHGREMPTEAELASFDAIILSGSRHAVYDSAQWIADVQRLVRDAYARQQRILGICFGAQLLAHSLGGLVEPAPVGWEAGARSVQLDLERIQRMPYGAQVCVPNFRVCELHQDAITTLPPGAQLLGSSTHCTHEIFALGDSVLAVQGHPEFTVETCVDLVQTRVEVGAMSPEQAATAYDSLAIEPPPQPTDPNNPLRHLCHSFLRT